MAMSELLKGSIFTREKHRPGKEKAVFDVDGLFLWIETIFASPEDRIHKFGRSAVQSMLKFNAEHGELLERVIRQCYHLSPQVSNGYFTAIIDVFSEQQYPSNVAKLMVLVLYKLSDSSANVRKAAIRLLQILERQYFVDSFLGEYEMTLVNCLPHSCTALYSDLFIRLASLHQELAYAIFSECTERFDNLSIYGQRYLLGVLLPWMSYVELSVSKEKELEEHSYVFLTNLVYLTLKYDQAYSEKFEALWSGLVGHGDNAKIIIYFLMHIAIKKRNSQFLMCAKKIITYLGRSSIRRQILNLITAEITPASLTPLMEASAEVQTFDSFMYMAPLDELIEVSSHGMLFSVGELAFIYMTDLVLEAGEELWIYLPLLLHMSFVFMDNMNFSICEHSKTMLINLIHSLLLRHHVGVTATKGIDLMLVQLEKQEGHRLWNNEDLANDQFGKAPPVLVDYLFQVLSLFGINHGLPQNWGELALHWGTNCSVKHIACRSLQIFGVILPAFDKSMVSDILARVADTIADVDAEVQSFALEELATLKAMVRSLDHDQLRSFPELLWSAIAMLFTNLEYEFLHVLDLLDEIIKSLDLDETNMQELILRYIPLDWSPPFCGIQPLVLKGLLSPVTDKVTLEFLNELLNVRIDALIDPSLGRFLFALLALSPYLILHFNEEDPEHDCYRLARNISSAIERKSEKSGAIRVLNNYVRRRFKLADDFVRQLCSNIGTEYFPQYQSDAILFLMELVKHGAEEYRLPVLILLRELVPFLKLGPAEDTASWCMDVVSPLTQYLSGSLKPSVLNVLKKFIELMDRSESIDLLQEGSLALVHARPRHADWIWKKGASNGAVTRENLIHVIKSCLGDSFVKRPSIVFSSADFADSSQTVDTFVQTSMASPTILKGEKSNVLVHPTAIFDTELSNIPVSTTGDPTSMRRKRADSTLTSVTRENFSPRRTGRPNSIEQSEFSPKLLIDHRDIPNDLTFNSVFRRTFSAPLRNASHGPMPKPSDITKVIITVRLSLSYNEILSIENFKTRFEQDIAKALRLDFTQVSVVLIEGDPLVENGFALVTFELSKDQSTPSSIKLHELAEEFLRQFTNPSSILFQGRSTCKLMHQDRPQIYIGRY